MTDPELCYIPYEEFVEDVQQVAAALEADRWAPDHIVGIGRGGLVPAAYLSHRTGISLLSVDYSSGVPSFAEELMAKLAGTTAEGRRLLLVDDINDSGGTIDYIRRLLAENGCDEANLRFAVIMTNSRSKADVEYWAQMIDRSEDKRWFVFPWEAVAASDTIVEEALSVPERLA